MRHVIALLMCVLPVSAAIAGSATWVDIPGGGFKSALKYEDVRKLVIAPFAMQSRPVTNAEFLAFVKQHPQWQRGKAPLVFAEERYLSHWSDPLQPGSSARARQPVVQVSWFAASAYCEAQGARLPTWSEWEYVAAADASRGDARTDSAWRERILAWYSTPSNQPLPEVGLETPNHYKLHDVHGLVWEWTEDFSALLVDGDNRSQGPDSAKFCGAGALSMDDQDNYAVLMRVALLSSLDASDTTGNLGFRCARSLR